MNSSKIALHNAETEIEKLMVKPRIIVTGREACPTTVEVDKICEEIWGRDEWKLESRPKGYKLFHVDIYGNEMIIP